MTKIILSGLTSNEISDLIRELKSQGYHVHKDFDFEYVPGRYDWASGQEMVRHTKFFWYNQSAAAWFVLRYC
jgi:hypothetical protein